MTQERLRVIPCELQMANAYVVKMHRHHYDLPVHKFSLAVIGEDETVRGVAICGRPVAANRMRNGNWVLEVSRLCTDGTPNACSALYGACARVARDLGYVRIITYILDEEPGTSLKASGWVYEGTAPGTARGQPWANRPGRRDIHPLGAKGRWSLTFRTDVPEPIWPKDLVPENPTLSLWEVGT